MNQTFIILVLLVHRHAGCSWTEIVRLEVKLIALCSRQRFDSGCRQDSGDVGIDSSCVLLELE